MFSLFSNLCEMGNPFEEEGKELLVLDRKLILGHQSVKALYEAEYMGKEQYEAFVKERLLDCTTSLRSTVSLNRIQLFLAQSLKQNKKAQQLKSLRCDVDLFSRMYIACQVRGKS